MARELEFNRNVNLRCSKEHFFRFGKPACFKQAQADLVVSRNKAGIGSHRSLQVWHSGFSAAQLSEKPAVFEVDGTARGLNSQLRPISCLRFGEFAALDVQLCRGRMNTGQPRVLLQRPPVFPKCVFRASDGGIVFRRRLSSAG